MNRSNFFSFDSILNWLPADINTISISELFLHKICITLLLHTFVVLFYQHITDNRSKRVALYSKATQLIRTVLTLLVLS